VASLVCLLSPFLLSYNSPQTFLNLICELIEEFLDAMLYIKTLEFEEKPNYEMIRGKFKQALQRLHLNKKDEILTDWQIDRKLKREEKKQ
jgi:hypothetical protein